MSNLFNLQNITGNTPVGDVLDDLIEACTSLLSEMSGAGIPSYVLPFMSFVDTNNNIKYYVDSTGTYTIIKDNLSKDNILELSADYSITLANHKQTLLMNATSGAITITLPTLSNVSDSGFCVHIKKNDYTDNLIYINYADIDGETTKILRVPNDSINLLYHNSKYYITSSYETPLKKYNTVTTSYSVTPSDNNGIILVNNTAPCSVTLPAVLSVAEGYAVTIKKISDAGNDVTILPSGSETIEDAASVVLSNKFDHVTLSTNQTSPWYTI